MNAINAISGKKLVEFLFYYLKDVISNVKAKKVLVFYCENGLNRSPFLMRLVRKMDRDIHNHIYPEIAYPEMYLLEGGY